MSLRLSDILGSDVLAAGDPVVVASAYAVGPARVRWVHSSEVLEIAPLLSGGELLLTGGHALLALRPAAQVEYVRSLASRGVAALAVETAGTGRHLPDELVGAAEAAGLPLVELRQVVPFVEVAEDVNRRIVSAQVASLRLADELSRALTERIASSGAALEPLLALIAETLDVHVRVVDTRGVLMGSAGPEPHTEARAERRGAELAVGGLAVAHLELVGDADTDAETVETVLARVRSIVALALARQSRPSLERLAEDQLLRSIAAGSNSERLVELAQASGLDPDRPVVMAAVRRPAGHTDSEQWSRRALPSSLVVTHGEWLDVLVPLKTSTHAERGSVLTALRASVAGSRFTAALGPTASTIRQAPLSLAEARATWRLGRSVKGSGGAYDASDFLVERMAERSLTRGVADALVEEALGELVRLEQRHGGELVQTLDVWISTGCNATETARVLFLERQSLHKRLRRIFDALGGDPRGRGQLVALGLAVRLVRGGAQLRDHPSA
ncbi:purine catabolism regulator [Humibacillus xanthopallidus]|uniref:Purine catabolism regulator n=1 Tax=Humibacillus xanthopallidus TaxID=412689 RepID=A0A543PM22_9MICO|nr:PucR family transcriptional regulator [Humibacillus xanthopallidus]TQN45128.1 purine catabolism regulator [Humibacillus xanthopallidus]